MVLDESSVDETTELAEETPSSGPDPQEIAAAIVGVDKRWTTSGTIVINGNEWQPSLVRKVGERLSLLHVHAADRLRSYAFSRMKAAFEDGVEIHVALPLRKLYDEALLMQLADVDALVHVIEGPLKKTPPRLLAALGDRGISVSMETRQALARRGHEISLGPGSAADKGRRLEALLAFLLSQVADFVVKQRNFRTKTGEIDIVVQQRSTTGRLWATLNAPYILVEAKNRSAPVTQEMFTVFRTKLQTSRGGARLGIIVAATYVTEDASLQELRFSTENITVAFITRRELEQWIEADDPDEWLETHFERAMLR